MQARKALPTSILVEKSRDYQALLHKGGISDRPKLLQSLPVALPFFLSDRRLEFAIY